MTWLGDFVTTQTVSFARMRKLLLDIGGGLQEGVVGAGDLKVSQRGAGANMSVDVAAGFAWVQIDTGTNNGLAHVSSDAVANVVVTASNATNPRIDQIIVRYNDTSIPTGSGNTPTPEVLTGTPTGGATLDNRTGAAALPNDCLRIADILVPATSTTVTTANIRDRRPFARGAYWDVTRTAGSYTTTSTTFVAIDATNLAPRIECSGVPLLVRLQSAYTANSSAGDTVTFELELDAVAQNRVREVASPATAALRMATAHEFRVTPAAGSHIVAVYWKVSGGTGTLQAGTTTGYTLTMSVEEIVRPNTSNT